MSNVERSRTRWYCERCGAKGRVEYPKHAGVWEVFVQIVEAHTKRAEKTKCTGGADELHVVMKTRASR